jgi:hypothetical protein
LRSDVSNSSSVAFPPVTQSRRCRFEAAVFRITAYCYDEYGVLKVANLGSWPCREYEGSVERLRDDDRFLEAVEDRLFAKG